MSTDVRERWTDDYERLVALYVRALSEMEEGRAGAEGFALGAAFMYVDQNAIPDETVEAAAWDAISRHHENHKHYLRGRLKRSLT